MNVNILRFIRALRYAQGDNDDFFFFPLKKQLNQGGFCTRIDLPDGTTKSPDVAWISPYRLAASPANEEGDFVKIVPDFVAEVRSQMQVQR